MQSLFALRKVNINSLAKNTMKFFGKNHLTTIPQMLIGYEVIERRRSTNK